MYAYHGPAALSIASSRAPGLPAPAREPPACLCAPEPGEAVILGRVGFRIKLASVCVLLVAVLAPNAAGSPQADLTSVARDYGPDRKITPCRFTAAQLASAASLITGDVATYAAGLDRAIAAELRRWKDGGCTARRVATAAGANLRIVKVQPKGGARRESVTIKNRGRTTVNLRGYALRDAADHTLRFRSTKLKAGRSLRVITGCRKGSRKPTRRGASYYACRSKQFWDDAGDTVELLGPGGGLLSVKTYP